MKDAIENGSYGCYWDDHKQGHKLIIERSCIIFIAAFGCFCLSHRLGYKVFVLCLPPRDETKKKRCENIVSDFQSVS